MIDCAGIPKYVSPLPVLTFGDYTVRKRPQRDWEVFDADGRLICITVYKRGALEVVKRMLELGSGKAADLMTNTAPRQLTLPMNSESSARPMPTKAERARPIRQQKRRQKPARVH